MGQQLPIFIDEVPDYEARGEFMFIRWRGLEVAMPISVCQKAVWRCSEALAKWQVEQLDHVVPFEAGAH